MHNQAPIQDAATGIRLDLWLWATRFFKTRGLAKLAIEAGRIDVNAIQGKAARLVRVGDRLLILRGDDRYEIDVSMLLDKRASAPVAQRCYRETAESRAAREAAVEQRRLAGAGYQKPATKPDKRARRLIIALGDFDAL